MKSEVKRAEGVYCPKCMALALVIEDKVFCQFCKNPDGSFKQIIPGENGK